MMKYIISIFVSGLSLIQPLYSQSKVELGLRIIPQLTSIRYSTGIGNTADFARTIAPKGFAPHYVRVRFAAGVGMLYYPLKRFRVGADLLYSLQGGGYEQRKTNLNYVKLPLWIGFNSLPKRRLIFVVQSGVEFSLLAVSKLKYHSGETESIGQYVNRMSWGVPLAMGIKFKFFSTFFMTAQVYVSTDFSTLSKTNKTLRAYNLIYPGLRLSIDQNMSNFRKK